MNEDDNDEVSIVEEQKVDEILSPSKKKRKLDSPIKLNQSSLDDGSTCTICLDHFNSSGAHRIVSLKCGHLYGNSCIATWMKDNKNCPSCKSKATARDLRFIYATKVQIVDNSREVELELEVQKLNQEKRDLVAKGSENAMTIALQRRQIKELTKQIERLKSYTLARSNSNELSSTIRSGRMYLEKTIEFKDNSDCRIIKIMLKSKKIIISQKATSTSLFTGYGVRLVDLNSHRCEKFINTSSKQILDVCHDPTETFLATTSRESTCKIYNIGTSQSIAALSPSISPIWSCSFDKNRENLIFLGTQSGHLYMYDIKKPNDVLQTVTSLDNKTPVKTIISMSKNETFLHGGYFVIHLRAIYFYEYTVEGNFKITKLNYDDSIVTASFDERTEMLLMTTPTGENKITNVVMKLTKVDDVPVLHEQYRFLTNQSGAPLITRPAQIKINDQSTIIACYSSDSREIQIFCADVGRLHTMIMQSPVLDISPIYNSESTSFVALCSSKCRIFKVNLEFG